MYTNIELWNKVHRRVLTGELSKRQACQKYQLHLGYVVEKSATSRTAKRIFERLRDEHVYPEGHSGRPFTRSHKPRSTHRPLI